MPFLIRSQAVRRKKRDAWQQVGLVAGFLAGRHFVGAVTVVLHSDLAAQQLLRKASTTRSAKKANEGFARIATTILSLEILASSFAGWSAIYPEAGSKAQTILRRNSRSTQMPLMEFYLYPPKYLSSAAVATLIPPVA